jgi:hypothetical protein
MLGSGQAMRNFLCPLVKRLHQGRPYVFHREPDQYQEHNHLNNQRASNTHFSSFPEFIRLALAATQPWLSLNRGIT